MKSDTKPIARHIHRILLISVILLILTLSFYSRSGLGWKAQGQYDAELTWVGIGLPHWLFINRLDLHGMPSPPSWAPDWREYQQEYPPGWHIHIGPLLVNVLGALALGTLFYGIALMSARHDPLARGHGAWQAYLIVIVPAIAVGAVPLSAPEWVTSVLGLAIILACVIVGAAMMRTYKHCVLLGILTVVTLRLSQKIADFLYSGYEIGDEFPSKDDLAMFSVSTLVLVLLALVATCISRFVAKRGMKAVAEGPY